jgi:hypothetical protein
MEEAIAARTAIGSFTAASHAETRATQQIDHTLPAEHGYYQSIAPVQWLAAAQSCPTWIPVTG